MKLRRILGIAHARRESPLDAAASVGLLALAIATVLVPLRHAAWSFAPPLLALVALLAGVVRPATAMTAARSLGAPLAFVLLAVPLAVLLDELGFFRELAGLLSGSRRYREWLWLLAAAVTAGLNLDAAVVLLTPLYVQIAARRRTSAFVLALQPALLSGLASSALPISNLTNLIAAARLHLGTAGFVLHLGLPTLVASAVGLLAYRLSFDRLAASGPPATAGGEDSSGGAGTAARDTRALAVGGSLVVLVVAGFLLVPLAGGQPFEVAAAADLVLVALTRRTPLAAIPWQVVVAVLGLGVLASGVATHLPLRSLLGGSSPAALARIVGIGTGASDAVNNLPALLVGLPGLQPGPSWGAWALLLGTNAGALLVPSGSLAVLLWMATLTRLGVRATTRHWWPASVLVALPALAAGLATLLALRVALGG